MVKLKKRHSIHLFVSRATNRNLSSMWKNHTQPVVWPLPLMSCSSYFFWSSFFNLCYPRHIDVGSGVIWNPQDSTKVKQHWHGSPTCSASMVVLESKAGLPNTSVVFCVFPCFVTLIVVPHPLELKQFVCICAHPRVYMLICVSTCLCGDASGRASSIIIYQINWQKMI